jgi:hypothetical protein
VTSTASGCSCAHFKLPLDNGTVGADTRIRAALPTIEQLRRRGAVLVLVSHLGRQKDREPELSLRPVADRLAELTGGRVTRWLSPASVPGACAARTDSSVAVTSAETTERHPARWWRAGRRNEKVRAFTPRRHG